MSHVPAAPAPPSRRSWLKWATHGLGALFGALLGLPAVAYLIDARNRTAADTSFKTVARLTDLEVGVPRQVVLRDLRHDAWTLHPNDVIGRVWLVRRDSQRVDAFTTICPHLGCSIDFQDSPDPRDRLFVCPCHGGKFKLDGELLSRELPPPRGMDKLEVRPDPADPKLIQVKFQNFIQGKDSAIPKT
jgi:Rieske Fe-S protein